MLRDPGRAAELWACGSGPCKAARLESVHSLTPKGERWGRAVNGRAGGGGGALGFGGGVPAGEEGAGAGSGWWVLRAALWGALVGDRRGVPEAGGTGVQAGVL